MFLVPSCGTFQDGDEFPQAHRKLLGHRTTTLMRRLPTNPGVPALGTTCRSATQGHNRPPPDPAQSRLRRFTRDGVGVECLQCCTPGEAVFMKDAQLNQIEDACVCKATQFSVVSIAVAKYIFESAHTGPGFIYRHKELLYNIECTRRWISPAVVSLVHRRKPAVQRCCLE